MKLYDDSLHNKAVSKKFVPLVSQEPECSEKSRPPVCPLRAR